MKIAVTQFITLDGVSQGPGSAEEDTTNGFRHGGWFVPYLDSELVRATSEWLDHAGALLLGRRTYEAFAQSWPHITEPDPFTGRMNALPKYVVSNTLSRGNWSPTTVLRGDAAESVASLKSAEGGEAQIHGSSTLAASLLAAGLVDTIRLAVAPAVVGEGRRLFGGAGIDAGFRLVTHTATSSGLLLLEYQAAGAAPLAQYAGVSATE